jgi:hypothetical protein
VKPETVLGTSVRFSSVAERVFFRHLEAKAREPSVVRERRTDPLGARMVFVRHFIASESRAFRERSAFAYSLRGSLLIQDPMASIEHLASLNNHLYNVFIALPPRTAAGVWV